MNLHPFGHQPEGFSFSERIPRAQIRKARSFFLRCPPRLCEEVAEWNPSVKFSFKPPRTPRVGYSFFSCKIRANDIISSKIRAKQKALTLQQCACAHCVGNRTAEPCFVNNLANKTGELVPRLSCRKTT